MIKTDPIEKIKAGRELDRLVAELFPNSTP